MVLPNVADYKSSGTLKWFERGTSSIILVVAFFAVTMPQFYFSIQSSKGLESTWIYEPIWRESAECARKTGAILVLCPGSRLVPIADETPGDDLGHALSLELFAMIAQRPIEPTDISVLNSVVNYAGISVLALLLFTMRLRGTALLILTLGPRFADMFHRLTPHPAQFGAACMAAILPLAILYFFDPKSNGRLGWIWLPTGMLCLILAALFRQSIGLMGVTASLVSVGLSCLLHWQDGQNRRKLIIMTALILLVQLFPTGLLKVRDMAYHLPPSTMEERHGAWHNLYIGLGAVPNPFGIEWLDASGRRAVEKINPNIPYLSAEYYGTLRREYFRILWHHPLEVFNVYYQKLTITLNTPLFRLFDVKWSLIGICILFAASRWRLRPPWRASDSAFAVSIIFAGFFVGQSMLLHYDMQYLFPIYLFVLMGFGSAIESIFTIKDAR